jgi:hypothetical protein
MHISPIVRYALIVSAAAYLGSQFTKWQAEEKTDPHTPSQAEKAVTVDLLRREMRYQYECAKTYVKKQVEADLELKMDKISVERAAFLRKEVEFYKSKAEPHYDAGWAKMKEVEAITGVPEVLK